MAAFQSTAKASAGIEIPSGFRGFGALTGAANGLLSID